MLLTATKCWVQIPATSILVKNIPGNEMIGHISSLSAARIVRPKYLALVNVSGFNFTFLVIETLTKWQ